MAFISLVSLLFFPDPVPATCPLLDAFLDYLLEAKLFPLKSYELLSINCSVMLISFMSLIRHFRKVHLQYNDVCELPEM
jgi:hypothetical protein